MSLRNDWGIVGRISTIHTTLRNGRHLKADLRHVNRTLDVRVVHNLQHIRLITLHLNSQVFLFIIGEDLS